LDKGDELLVPRVFPHNGDMKCRVDVKYHNDATLYVDGKNPALKEEYS